MRHNHEERFVRRFQCMRSEIFDALLSDDVGEIIFSIISPVSHHFPVHVQGVVVEAGVPDQTRPVVPSRWDTLSVIVVQVFPEICYDEKEA